METLVRGLEIWKCRAMYRRCSSALHNVQRSDAASVILHVDKVTTRRFGVVLFIFEDAVVDKSCVLPLFILYQPRGHDLFCICELNGLELPES